VAAMLRLGSKYEFQHLREEALVRLRAEFPTTLGDWDRLPSDFTHIQEQKGILFDIVNLALEQGLLSILPAAYYLCIQDDIVCDGFSISLESILNSFSGKNFQRQNQRRRVESFSPSRSATSLHHWKTEDPGTTS
jgi:hypothetical protein